MRAQEGREGRLRALRGARSPGRDLPGGCAHARPGASVSSHQTVCTQALCLRPSFHLCVPAGDVGGSVYGCSGADGCLEGASPKVFATASELSERRDRAVAWTLGDPRCTGELSRSAWAALGKAPACLWLEKPQWQRTAAKFFSHLLCGRPCSEPVASQSRLEVSIIMGLN